MSKSAELLVLCNYRILQNTKKDQFCYYSLQLIIGVFCCADALVGVFCIWSKSKVDYKLY